MLPKQTNSTEIGGFSDAILTGTSSLGSAIGTLVHKFKMFLRDDVVLWLTPDD
jgi:hypothetical protein